MFGANELYLEGGENIAAGLQVFDLEWGNIKAGQAWSAEQAATDEQATWLCMRYSLDCAYILGLRLHPREYITWLVAAVAAAQRLGDRHGEGNALGNLGLAYADIGDAPRAIEFHTQSLAIAREIEHPRNEEKVLNNLGNAHLDLGHT